MLTPSHVIVATSDMLVLWNCRFAFIHFSQESEAVSAIAKMNGYSIWVGRPLVVTFFGDFHKYTSIPDEEIEYLPPTFFPKVPNAQLALAAPICSLAWVPCAPQPNAAGSTGKHAQLAGG